jgi:hypothetical protein
MCYRGLVVTIVVMTKQVSKRMIQTSCSSWTGGSLFVRPIIDYLGRQI